MPVTRAMPASGIFSNNSLSMSSQVCGLMTFLVASGTNCRRQSLHRRLLLPLWILPFLTVCSEPHGGQFIAYPLLEGMVSSLLCAHYPWIKPEGAVAVLDASVAPPEASCRGSQAYERRKYWERL